MEDWKGEVSEELREDPSLQDIGSVDELAKSFISSQKMIGGSVRIPSAEASNDDRLAFYQKLDQAGIAVVPKEEGDSFRALANKSLGVPSSASDYGIKPYVGKQVDDTAAANDFLKFAHEAGLSKQQVELFYNKRASELQAQDQDMEAKNDEIGLSLQREFGAGLKQAIDLGESALREIGDPDIVNMLQETGLNNNAAMLKLLARVGSLLNEPSGADFSNDRPRVGVTPDDAAEQIAEIMGNKDHPYHDRSSAEHKTAVDKMARLFKIKNGEL